jgi:hypothetical protein
VNHSSRRVNTLARALGARRYLEIGVATGDTFTSVEVPDRTAVDPLFQFDTAPLTNERTRFVHATSDAFFADAVVGDPFDIIFIDGLHAFEQVVRDLMNSLVFSHERSVFIVDDTYPSNVYSALPDYHAAMRFKRMFNNDDGAWYGDVFKTVFFIHDFCPSLNYRTIVGSGNPQTLVWREAGAPRAARMSGLEALSRMSFFDFIDNVDIVRACSEEEALAACVGALTAQVRAPRLM